MGCGIEPRKIRYRRGREFLFARRQHVRRRHARCRRPAGVEGHITFKRIVSEPGRSRVWPPVSCGVAEYGGPHREGEERAARLAAILVGESPTSIGVQSML